MKVRFMDKVFQYIDQHRERFISELMEFCRFPSVSAQRVRDKDTRACAQWLVKHLTGLGLEATLIETSGQPIIRARGKKSSSKRIICYGHYDVQPEDPRHLWQSDPFEPQMRDGYLIGRGTTDDKGQLWAHVKAIEAILQTRGELPLEVIFLVEGEEECGGTGLADYITRQADELKDHLAAVLISDGGMWNESTPAITYGLRGIAALEVVLHGPNRDLHSGSFGGAVANPALALAQLLAKCYGSDGRVLVDGFYDDVRDISAAERKRLAALGHDEAVLAQSLNVPRLTGEQGYSALERMWARPTLEINGIYGGYQGQGGKTIIPSCAGVKLTVRLVPDQQPEVIIRRTLDFLRANCPDTVRLEVLRNEGGGRPLFFDPDQPALRQAAAALSKGFGRECVFIREGGSIPVAETFWTQLKTPVLLMGLGLASDGAHAPNEHFKLDSMIKGAKSIATLIDSLAR